MENAFEPNRDYPKLALIIPCYNEEEVIEDTIKELIKILSEYIKENKIAPDSFLYFIDDGSKDKTFEIIRKYHQINPVVKGLKFSKNFGNQPAIFAGLKESRKLNADCVISIDADLQQDTNAIKCFLEKFKEGADLVFGIREEHKGVGLFKKSSSELFYNFMNMLGANIIKNHSEYRLVSSKAIDILSEFGEYNIFLRGLFNNIGLKKDYITYSVKERSNGTSKFSLRSLIALALNGITSYTNIPLRLVSVLGILIFLFSIGLILNVLYEKYILQITIEGWATIVISTAFFAGVEIFCLGVIGEYLGRIYGEVKHRPRYIKDIELI